MHNLQVLLILLVLLNYSLSEHDTERGSLILCGLREVIVSTKSEVYAILEQGSVKRQITHAQSR
jgi:hypothetical protein